MTDEQKRIVAALNARGFFVWCSPQGEIVYAKPNAEPSQFRIVRGTEAACR